MKDNVFGNRLRMLLDEKDIEGKEFAKFLHVQPPTLSNWLNGNRFPKDREILTKISNYLDVSLDYLLGKSDTRNIQVSETATQEVCTKPSNPLIEQIESLSPESLQDLEKYLELLKTKEQIDKSKEDPSSTLEKDA